MKAKFTLLARVSRPDGSHPFIVMSFVKGRPIAIPEATCHYIRYTEDGKRVTESLGKDLATAFLRYKNLQLSRDAAEAGIMLAIPKHEPKTPRVLLQSAYEKYVDDLHALGRSKATITAYRFAVSNFLDCCEKNYVDEISRDDIIAYISWMRTNLLRRKMGDQTVTIRTRLRGLNTFLIRFGKPNVLPTREWPRATKRRPNQYLRAELKALLRTATPDEAFLIEFLLYTGFRSGEATHAEYSDFNPETRVIRAQSKPQWSWFLKDHEERDIPLPEKFAAKLLARQANAKQALIFPNRDGRPGKNFLLKTLKKAGLRAGLPDAAITLHKMRRTFATMMSLKFPIQTVRDMLGHSDIQTTALYLAGEDVTSTATRATVNEVFSAMSD